MRLRESFHALTQKARHFLKEDVEGAPREPVGTGAVTSLTPFIVPTLIHDNLPYQYVDESGFFINKESVGFGLMIEPSSGADETLMLSLANLIQNKLPPEVEVQCMLVAHPWVGESLRTGLVGTQSDNPILRELAMQSLAYHQQAALQGYKNPRRIPAMLKDYQVFFFVSQKCGKNPPPIIQALKTLREDIEVEFYSAHLAFSPLELPMFLKLVRRLLTPNIHTVEWPTVSYDSDLTLNHQCIEKGTSWTVEKNYLDVTYMHENEKEERDFKTTRVINLGLNEMPKEFRLWMMPDNYSNIFKSDKGLTCPFVMNLLFKVKSKTQSQNKANAAFMVAEQTSGGSKDKFVTGAQETRAERRAMRDLLNDDKVVECDMLLSLTLFSTPKHAKHDETQAVSAFRKNGIQLYSTQLLQMPHYLACLPFLSSEGLWQELDRFGVVRHKLKHYNVANLLPIVADFKGTRRGMLLPTYRHQLAFIDIFNDRFLPITNYNMTIAASTGSGKSVFCQSLIEYLLGIKAQVFVIDNGNSYKHFCEFIEGDYIDASTITLNPFTLFDFSEDENAEGRNSSEMIRNLLVVMAKSEEDLSGACKNWLLEAATYIKETKKNEANMDDVINFLREIEKSLGYHDQRLSDLILSLKKYGTGGLYGKIFNGKTPLLNKNPFVVVELSAFKQQPELLRIIKYVMRAIINGQFHHAPRDTYKFCLIEEASDDLRKNQSEQDADFIEDGARRARKYRGSFCTVAQLQSDFDASPQGKAIQACSDIKIILRQGDDFDVYTQTYPKKFTIAEQELIKKFGEAKNNGYSEIMLKIGKISSFHRLFLNSFTKVLFSSDGPEFEAVEHWKRQGLSVIEAAKKVSREFYGEGA